MWVVGRWIEPAVVKRINDAVAMEPTLTRSALSRQVCGWMQWRDATGKLQEVSCRKVLLELERRDVVSLPKAREVANFAGQRGRRELIGVPAPEVECSLADLGRVKVVAVSGRYSRASAVWNSLMDAYHELGDGPLCGAQIRYVIQSETYGSIGGLSFSAATKQLKRRDEWIGWSEQARRANLQRVVCNSRFLIAPGVKVPNLASHALRLAIEQLPGDWQAKYGYEPVLVETFVDRQRFLGTCYRAASWQQVGQTAGRSDGFSNGKKASGKKDIFVRPLRADFQKILSQEPEAPLVLRGKLAEGSEWAEQEFQGSQVHEGRLRRRLYTVARDFFAQPGELIPQVCGGSEAKAKAAYRFMSNKRINMQMLLKGHVEASAQRAQKHSVVLAVQDTTSLDYTAHPASEGIGPINTTKDSTVGLILHDTMAFSTEGTPLGVLDAQCWARDPDEAGKRNKRKELPIEAKESMKWLRSYRAVAQVQQLCPDTTFVSVGDREADIYDLFDEVQRTDGGPKVLVRADRARQRKVIEGEPAEATHEYLWDKLLSEPVCAQMQVRVPQRGSRPARTATIEVRYAPVTLKAPKNKPLDPVSIWAVYAREVDHGPEVSEPLDWMLLTTVAVSNAEDALERLRWYTLRWGIEIYHRVLKSGCRIEDRQLDRADRIENCLAIDMVVAWRIYWLTMQGRETPDLPCDLILEQDEWKVLHMVVRNAPPPSAPPSMRQAVRMVAALGGFLGRKSDGEPGTTTIWRGLVRLEAMVIGSRATLVHAKQRDGP